jgi:hypothetical protein
MRLPGFRRDIRPGSDLREWWMYLQDYTTLRLLISFTFPCLAVGGLVALLRGSWTYGAIALPLGLAAGTYFVAWLNFYRHPERPETVGNGRHVG